MIKPKIKLKQQETNIVKQAQGLAKSGTMSFLLQTNPIKKAKKALNRRF